MNILFTITDSYVPWCGVALKSLVDSNKELLLNVYIVGEDISDGNKDMLLDMVKDNANVKLYFPTIPEDVKSGMEKIKQFIPYTHNTSFLLRLYMDKILPVDLDNVLYADTDVVFNNTLAELENYEFEQGKFVGVVKDLVRWDDYCRLGINRDNHIYFNAGVMLVNLNKWREQNIGNLCLKEIEIHGKEYYMVDQDALNVVLEGKVQYLNPKFNFLTPFVARREFTKYRVRPEELTLINEAKDKPAIIHYVFVNKPWFKGEYLPYRDLWNNAFSMTPWKDRQLTFRHGWKGALRVKGKAIAQNVLGFVGIDYKPNIFIKKRFKHIQLIFLLIYYCIGQYLPDSFSRFGGKLSNRFRVWCVRRLFDYVGKNVNIGRKAHFGKGEGVWLGNNSNIGAYCHVPSNMVIGDDVMMGPNNYFFENVTHRHNDITCHMIKQGVTSVTGFIEIGDDVWIGRECMIMPAKKIGSHSIIGARALVTKDVQDWVVVGGNPAKVIKARK